MATIPQEQLDGMKRFYTPLVSDTMDRMGIAGGGALHRDIQPVLPDPALKVCGLAFPCRVCLTTEYVEIDTLLQMVDAIPPNAFVLVASDAPIDAALWGGMMSARARARGAVAAIVNGDVRDVEQIAALGFPVFGAGRCIKDIRRRGYMHSYNVPVTCNGTDVRPGDVLFGDINGVIVIPAEHFPDVYAALDSAWTEEAGTQRGLISGQSAQGLFERYGRF